MYRGGPSSSVVLIVIRALVTLLTVQSLLSKLPAFSASLQMSLAAVWMPKLVVFLPIAIAELLINWIAESTSLRWRLLQKSVSVSVSDQLELMES